MTAKEVLFHKEGRAKRMRGAYLSGQSRAFDPEPQPEQYEDLVQAGVIDPGSLAMDPQVHGTEGARCRF